MLDAERTARYLMSAVDSIIDEPLVQSGEYLVDRSAWCELGNKERYKKYSEDPHGD
jgi:hypothetical protein